MKKVSVIIPCYNEEKTIQALLNALAGQTYPVDDFDVVIADGMSTDSTRQKILDFGQVHSELKIKIVDNPRKIIPVGLNLAIQASSGEIIIRLDGHSVPAKNYIESCVKILELGTAANVGGRWDIHAGAKGWEAESIAAAAANPIGVGDAFYRYSDKAGEVDTVPFGAYYRKTLIDLHGFDESLLTNEDYELNTRIRQLGGKIWFDPAIRSIYYARTTYRSLGQQYYRYGFWKAQMIKRYPGTIKWRQLLPPLFVAILFLLIILSILFPYVWVLLVAELAIYGLILSLSGMFDAIRKKNPGLAIGEPLAIATMHNCWGLGFIIGLLKNHKKS